MRFALGMNATEIGERLGRSEPAVPALRHTGRRRPCAEPARLEAARMVCAAA
jgi:hypothetical protein